MTTVCVTSAVGLLWVMGWSFNWLNILHMLMAVVWVCVHIWVPAQMQRCHTFSTLKQFLQFPLCTTTTIWYSTCVHAHFHMHFKVDISVKLYIEADSKLFAISRCFSFIEKSRYFVEFDTDATVVLCFVCQVVVLVSRELVKHLCSVQVVKCIHNSPSPLL